MPLALVILGVVLLIAAIRDTVADLGQLVAGDFSGKNNFFFWVVSIVLVGSIGYIPQLRNVSRAFLILILMVMILTNGALFDNLHGAVSNAQAPAPSDQTKSQASIPRGSAGGVASGGAASGGGKPGGGGIGGLAGIIGKVGGFAVGGPAGAAVGGKLGGLLKGVSKLAGIFG